MGGGTYNFNARATSSVTKGFNKATVDSLDTVFKQQRQRRVHDSLDPRGVVIRESRDGEDHPESLAILVGIDVTTSMGNVPVLLIRDGLPNMIQRIFEEGIADPQVAFIAIGDHECDNYPLQIGQFESSDQLLDESLTNTYIEGGGGGNGGESYLLAWYHAAMHTSIDCFEKRGQKGVLITIGDEPCLNKVSGSVLARLYNLQSELDYSAAELLKLASEKYDVYHINVGSTYSGYRSSTKNYWKELLSDHFIDAKSHEDIPRIVAELTSKSYSGTRQKVETDYAEAYNGSPTDVDDIKEPKITL
jgi:hypothetical protein